VILLPHRIEQTRRDQILHLGQQALKLLENHAASQREFEALPRSDQKMILKHRSGAQNARTAVERKCSSIPIIFTKLLSLGAGQNWLGLKQNVVRAEGLEPSWAV
jgi:hypothetical protein